MSKARNNRTPSRTPVPMKARPGELFADKQNRQRELGLDAKENNKGFKPRVASLLKGLRNKVKGQ